MPNRKQILVVDDEEDIRDLLTVLLEREGYKVATANNGLEAMEHLEHRTPDLMILDMMMLPMDGLSVMKELEQQGKEMPILVLTAHDAAYQTAVRRLGRGCCLLKPFETPVFLDRVAVLSRA